MSLVGVASLELDYVAGMVSYGLVLLEYVLVVSCKLVYVDVENL